MVCLKIVFCATTIMQAMVSSIKNSQLKQELPIAQFDPICSTIREYLKDVLRSCISVKVEM